MTKAASTEARTEMAQVVFDDAKGGDNRGEYYGVNVTAQVPNRVGMIKGASAEV